MRKRYLIAPLALSCQILLAGTPPDSFKTFVKKDQAEAKAFYNNTQKSRSAQKSRPAKWAKPIKCDGAPNLYIVSSNLYRCAQPSAEGMRNLKKLGIKTVVNLREFHSDRDEIGKTELNYVHIKTKAWHMQPEDAVRFLKIATDTNKVPVLVHCKRGADRTGAMCAIYRIAVQDWPPEEAIKELKHGGYGFNKLLGNIPKWIEKIDIKDLRRNAGIKIVSPEKPAKTIPEK